MDKGWKEGKKKEDFECFSEEVAEWTLTQSPPRIADVRMMARTEEKLQGRG
jgi:hypothetical protein